MRRRLAGLFESNAGPLLRFLMPLVLLAVIYVPLRRALDEVAWQVRVRTAVEASLARLPHKIVQSRVRVEGHAVDVLLVILGQTKDAEDSRQRLDASIQQVSGVAPRLEILAIPDANALAGLESSMRARATSLPLLPAVLTSEEQLQNSRQLIRSNVTRVWPTSAAGEPLVIEVDTVSNDPLRVRVVHLGPRLGADALEGLQRSLRDNLGREVHLVDAAIPREPIVRTQNPLAFVSQLAMGLRASEALSDVSVCVVEPARPSGRRRPDAREQELAETVKALVAAHPRASTEVGESWSVRFVHGECHPRAASAEVPEMAPSAAPPTDAKGPLP